MSTATAFGPIVAASDVEQRLLDLVQLWLQTYLAEVDRQQLQPVGTLPPPRSYVLSSQIEKMPEHQLPAILVSSPGTTELPTADGGGVYTARWNAEVGVHLTARGNMLALRLARLYAAALRALVLQQQALTDLQLRRIDWLGERYDTLPSIDDRTVCTARVQLAVEVADVTTRHAGPTTPEIEPGPDSPTWPESTVAIVDIEKESIP